MAKGKGYTTAVWRYCPTGNPAVLGLTAQRCLDARTSQSGSETRVANARLDVLKPMCGQRDSGRSVQHQPQIQACSG